MRVLTILTMVAAFGGGLASAQENKGRGLPLTSLPAVVQKSVHDNLMGGVIRHIGKEKEDGVVQYEVESILDGKARDFDIDVKGNLLSVEVATGIDAIPAAARASIMSKVADGKLRTVETVTKTGKPSLYEVAWTDKKGKKREALFQANGAETKE